MKKVITLKRIKYKGEFIPAGKTLELSDGDAAAFAKAGLVSANAAAVAEAEVKELDPSMTIEELIAAIGTMTVKEIKEYLEQLDVSYEPKAKKEDLVRLLAESYKESAAD
ncbi:HeH/LEM domain-containing protein [Geovibrio ferrireducens]|uniref:HeH/LEM domain-containing protein n=1 Tax=Geovibrio ferrireducens TaxID=46201 RepID=UPI002245C791|nr:HeH/LEM domain-containing protein [Geovibrio ferrireducens]